MAEKFTSTTLPREKMAHWLFGFVGLAWLYRFFCVAWMHQWEAPVLIYPYVDVSYWMVHYLGLARGVSGAFWSALLFDCALTVSIIGCLVRVRWRIFPIMYGLLFGLYMIAWNSFGMHHTHYLIGLWLIAVPFCVRSAALFGLLWEGLRYFTVFLYACAFAWKVSRGALLHPNQALAVFLENQGSRIWYNQDGFWVEFAQFFLAQPTLLQAMYVGAISIQAFFWVGFFTKKLDKILFILPFLFHAGTYFFVGVCFYELLILNAVFLPWHKYYKISAVATTEKEKSMR